MTSRINLKELLVRESEQVEWKEGVADVEDGQTMKVLAPNNQMMVLLLMINKTKKIKALPISNKNDPIVEDIIIPMSVTVVERPKNNNLANQKTMKQLLKMLFVIWLVK